MGIVLDCVVHVIQISGYFIVLDVFAGLSVSQGVDLMHMVFIFCLLLAFVRCGLIRQVFVLV